jgi:hypothetical protein
LLGLLAALATLEALPGQTGGLMTKLHSPSGDRYIELNEPAARHHFEGLTHHIDLINAFDHYDIGARWANPETQAGAIADSASIEAYQFAVASLAGAILQLADIGLFMCSPNAVLPGSCVGISTDSKGKVNVKLAKYCVGREVHGLPLGAYIHAGRNQFAHWGDEREPRSIGRMARRISSIHAGRVRSAPDTPLQPSVRRSCL